ncbi:MAG TPA: aminopeptidase, partial [Verrucomicrobiae bacterium]|nr:aminopeptidase [Verrucomicrobiae bacterium]
MLKVLKRFRQLKNQFTIKRLLSAALLLIAVAAVSGCHTVGFYGQAIKGQYQIFAHQHEIQSLLSASNTPSALRERLVVLEDLRAFARKELKLPVDSHYLKYVDVHR